jgi:hypothetical protein
MSEGPKTPFWLQAITRLLMGAAIVLVWLWPNDFFIGIAITAVSTWYACLAVLGYRNARRKIAERRKPIPEKTISH